VAEGAMYSDLALAISRGTKSKLRTRLIGEMGPAHLGRGWRSLPPRRIVSAATPVVNGGGGGQVGSVVVLVDRNRASLTKGWNNYR
jgi:hypothetical protein